MEIGKLEVGKTYDVEGIIANLKGPEDTITKFGERKRAWCLIGDKTGEVAITLWGNQTKGICNGAGIMVMDALCEEYNGKKQLKTNKNTKVRITVPQEQSTLQSNTPPSEAEQGGGSPEISPPVGATDRPISFPPLSDSRAVMRQKMNKAKIGIESAAQALDELERMMGD